MGMGIAELRRELEAARERISEGKTDEGLQKLDRAIEELRSELLTTTQAKEWLGLGSVNTLKLLVRKAGLQTQQHGNRMMIPVRELERLQDSPLLRGIHASDQLHDASAGLGSSGPLADDELEALTVARPGWLPWSDARSTNLA